MGGPPGLMGGPAGPCLAVIDMQRVFAEPDSPWLAPRFADIIEPVGKLVEAFQPNVVFTRFIAPAEPWGSWREYYQAWPFALQPPDADIYQLVDEFAGWSGHMLDAVTFSKWGPQLRGHVQGSGRLVLCGVATDCCLLSTAVAAADEGVYVRVVEEACAGASEDSHRNALDILRTYAPLIEVVGLADILGG
jgi:nicotinamidase-related amidase